MMTATLTAPPEELRQPTPLDEFESMLATLPPIEFPLVHSFTPGIYIRQCVLPAGSLLTSMEHKTEHHFIIVSGTVDVISAFERVTYVGPYMGVTLPGTKRVLYAHTDTLWITIHANPENLTDPDEIGARILEPNETFNGWRSGNSPAIGYINGIEPKEKTS